MVSLSTDIDKFRRNSRHPSEPGMLNHHRHSLDITNPSRLDWQQTQTRQSSTSTTSAHTPVSVKFCYLGWLGLFYNKNGTIVLRESRRLITRNNLVWGLSRDGDGISVLTSTRSEGTRDIQWSAIYPTITDTAQTNPYCLDLQQTKTRQSSTCTTWTSKLYRSKPRLTQTTSHTIRTSSPWLENSDQYQRWPTELRWEMGTNVVIRH